MIIEDGHGIGIGGLGKACVYLIFLDMWNKEGEDGMAVGTMSCICGLYNGYLFWGGGLFGVPGFLLYSA